MGESCPSRAAIGLPKDRKEKPIIRFWPTPKRQRRGPLSGGEGQKNSRPLVPKARRRPIFATFHDAFSFDSDFNSLIGPGLLTCLLPRAAAMSRKRIPMRRGKDD